MCPPSCRCWRPSSRRVGSGPVVGLAPLRQLKKIPRVIITDGLQAYAYLLPGSETCPLSGSSPAGRDPLAQAALRDRRGDRCAQADDEKRCCRPGRSAPCGADWRGWAWASELGLIPWVSRVDEKPPQPSAAWAVPGCPRPLMPSSASSGPSSGSTKPARGLTPSSAQTGAGPLFGGLGHPARTTGQAPIE